MTAPMLSDRALAPLRAVSEAGMRHSVVRGVSVTTPGPGASRVTVWTYTIEPIKGLLIVLSEEARSRADAPANAELYVLKLPSGTPIAAGERFQVSGETGSESWTREVLVQRPIFPKAQQVTRRAICVDVKANP